MPQEFGYQLKISKERIAVLIGKNGETKKQIETETKTKLSIDSDEGDVSLRGKDAMSLYGAREVVRAVGRGFNPEIALMLLKGDYCLDMISVADYAKNKNDIMRIKGRVIGSEGKSRRLIEELTETHVSVYGKTISIIGLPEDIAYARRAIESLLKGSTHANVYKLLEKRRRAMKIRGFIGENA